VSAAWYQLRDGGKSLLLTLYIQPNASRTEVAGLHDGALKIKVAAPPADHLANDKLLEFLTKSFKVSKKQVILKRGEHARHKTVEILDPACAPEMLLD
jgi:uncharacterized protein (TIGR00251 family)